MLRLLKRVAWLGVLAAGLPAAQAFSLLGPPNEAWQVPDLGYMVPLRADIGAPKNIGEDYRRNTPVLYYAFDENFLDYFGSNGVWAVDQAFAILNNLTNVSTLQRGPVGGSARSETLQSDRRGLEPDGPEIGGARHHGGANGPGRPDPLHLDPA